MNPLFSVVIAAYNAEDYIAESLDSLINQSIGFAEHIEVIIVNDGSTDGTASVCKEYLSRYPQNFKYLETENSGVSSARNLGLSQATGKYVNFLDSDDLWSNDSFISAKDFFLAHREVKIASAKYLFFGAKEGEHPLNYKFHSDQVIDITKTFDFPQLSASSAFMDRELVSSIRFSPLLSVSEDFRLVAEAILREGKFGVMHQPVYWYRKHENGSSAIENSTQNLSWYSQTPTLCYRYLFDLSKQLYGQILPYIQYAVMYDLQWRFPATHYPMPLAEEQVTQYQDLLRSLLAEIDDRIINAQRSLNAAQRLDVFATKYQTSLADLAASAYVINNDIYVRTGSTTIFLDKIQGHHTVILDFLEHHGNSITISGHLNTILPADLFRLRVSLFKETDQASTLYFADFSPSPGKIYRGNFRGELSNEIEFSITLPLHKNTRFSLLIAGHSVTPMLQPGTFFPLSKRPAAYALLNAQQAIFFSNSHTLTTRTPSLWWLLKRNTRFLLMNIISKQDAGQYTWLYLRSVIRAYRGKRKKVWLFSDRASFAGDNGEAFFRYVVKHRPGGVKPCFVLAKDSPDYRRISSVGKVVPFGSKKHVKMLLCSEFFISSSFDMHVLNPLASQRDLFRDRLDFKFIFLQHGIIKDDMSKFMPRKQRNIRLFVTAAQAEYNSIVNTPGYGYGTEVVKLTGLPRHDHLRQVKDTHVPEKKLLLLPTWRRNLVGKLDASTGLHAIPDTFVETDYFQYYFQLINHPDLIRAAKDTGTRITFLLHPALLGAADMFTSDYVQIKTTYDYQYEFLSSSIAMTDYSSAIFDFALLEKPIVYSHHDKEEFFNSHMETGYYDYERDGYGPIMYDLDSTVAKLVEYMHNPVMEQRYRDRVHSFFYTPATTSCAEILHEIEAMRNP